MRLNSLLDAAGRPERDENGAVVTGFEVEMRKLLVVSDQPRELCKHEQRPSVSG